MPVTSGMQENSCLAAAAIHSMWFQHKGSTRPTIATVSFMDFVDMEEGIFGLNQGYCRHACDVSNAGKIMFGSCCQSLHVVSTQRLFVGDDRNTELHGLR
jgi:hypothetical protein